MRYWTFVLSLRTVRKLQMFTIVRESLRCGCYWDANSPTEMNTVYNSNKGKGRSTLSWHLKACWIKCWTFFSNIFLQANKSLPKHKCECGLRIILKLWNCQTESGSILVQAGCAESSGKRIFLSLESCFSIIINTDFFLLQILDLSQIFCSS